MAECSELKEKSLTCEALLCPLCLQTLESPLTLSNCLHTFCKECLADVTQITHDDTTGWSCPRCATFSSVEDAKANTFLQKVLKLCNDNDENKGILICKQCCTEKEVNWYCDDCGIELCELCQKGHTNIPILKNHQIKNLDPMASKRLVIDEVVLCETHQDKIVEINCKTCEIPMCLLCKVSEHSDHETETVNGALERLLPDLEHRGEIISKNIERLEAKLKSVRVKIEDTKHAYDGTRQKVHHRIEQLISELRVIENEQTEMLVIEEENAVHALEDIKITLEKEVEKTKELLDVSRLTKQFAANTSLLQEIQGGLMQQAIGASDKVPQALLISTPHQHLTMKHSKKEAKLALSDIFGKIEETSVKCKISADGQLIENHYICEELRFGNTFLYKPTDTITLPGYCARIYLIDTCVYIPVGNYILEYNIAGDHINKVQLSHCAKVVKKLHSGEVAVGGSEGLFIYKLLTKDEEPLKLAAGKFSDLEVYGDCFFALQWKTNEIMVFRLDKQRQSTWERNNTLQISFISEGHGADTFCLHNDKWVICSLKDKCIYVCNKQGGLVQTVPKGNSLLVCGVDYSENILIADYTTKKLVITQGQNMGDIRKSYCLNSRPLDVVLDQQGYIWVLVCSESSGSGEKIYQILKYKHK